MSLKDKIKFIKEHPKEWKKLQAKKIRKMNKLARELGYPRGVKQMIEEGAI